MKSAQDVHFFVMLLNYITTVPMREKETNIIIKDECTGRIVHSKRMKEKGAITL